MAKLPLSTSGPMKESIRIIPNFKTLKSEFEDLGEEKRKRKALYPKRDLMFGYDGETLTEGREMWQFYLDRSGSYESFNTFIPWSDVYENEYVGTGDGSTTVFNLPGENCTSYTVYIDDVSKSEGTDYTFGDGTGADGADRVTFTAAPAAGERITFDFTGNLKIHGRFMNDSLDFETFQNMYIRQEIAIKGLLNE